MQLMDEKVLFSILGRNKFTATGKHMKKSFLTGFSKPKFTKDSVE